jgi:large subunit ribosomal protein L9
MKVILIDDVFELGQRGQVINVSNGYGRNYLIPMKLAVPATPANLRSIEDQKVALAKKESQHKGDAEIMARELGLVHVLISRKAGDGGVLFGSVTTKDIVELLQKKGFSLDRRKVLLEQPIKAIGNYTIKARPHSQVEALFILSVLPELDKPIAKVMDRGQDSDRVIHELHSKVQEIQQRTGADQLGAIPKGAAPVAPPSAASPEASPTESEPEESDQPVELQESEAASPEPPEPEEPRE